MLDPLASSPGRRPSGARLYHRGSIFAEPARCRMDRALAWRLLASAEALDRATRTKGQHGGCLKRTGLDVLRALLRAFYSYRDGTCFPSHAAIAAAAGCCVETVRKAIRRLEAAGFISTLRRKVVASFVSHIRRVRFDVAVQTSNSYTFSLPGDGNQPASIDAVSPAGTAGKEPDAKFQHETGLEVFSKRAAPPDSASDDLAADKARWITALFATDKPGSSPC